MSEFARSGLIMVGLVTAMCGAVIFATEPARCRQRELALKYDRDQRNQSRRTP